MVVFDDDAAVELAAAPTHFDAAPDQFVGVVVAVVADDVGRICRERPDPRE